MTSLPEASALCWERLDAKHIFIICNLSFRRSRNKCESESERGAREAGRRSNGNQTLCEIETMSESFQAWTQIQPYVASGELSDGLLRDAWKVSFSKTRLPSVIASSPEEERITVWTQMDRGRGSFPTSALFPFADFLRFSALPRFQCKLYLLFW